ncbi:SURF1 family protein [Ramlibacter albus]|uniref:SURF1-like protein n=1 Tax=Ramlibacter albus TaxID=2079448 RepID=A0A923S0D0_9BURK|nr:SURF1 family protein [Ramlibacter albus]MBC5763130.1 SURF1 family protein [Ramlibacter albus]
MKGRRSWLVTAAAMLGCAVTLALGFWQWGRAQQKLELQSAMEAREKLPPVDIREVLAAPDIAPFQHRRVRLRGTWGAPVVFLDNRQMEGKVGFYVVAPLQVDGGAVAVQRGWAPRNFERREQLPAVTTPAGTVEIEARIAPPPAKLYAFAEAEQGPIRQNLDLARFGAESRLPLATQFSVQQLGPASEGLSRRWPQAGSGAEKNWGYAFQWWALSALIAILYVWFQFVRPSRAARAPR